MRNLHTFVIKSSIYNIKLVVVSPQQIDDMLAGSLSQEDEDAVLAELEALTQVGLISIPVNVCPLVFFDSFVYLKLKLT